MKTMIKSFAITFLLVMSAGCESAKMDSCSVRSLLAANQGRKVLEWIKQSRPIDWKCKSESILVTIAGADADGVPEILHAMLERGADARQTATVLGVANVSALHLAALARDVESIKVLLEYGADPNARDALGSTPLISVAAGGVGEEVERDVIAARLLLQAGAERELRANTGVTAADVARKLGKTYLLAVVE